MKTLQKYAADINKCSKCGLCQSVCPVYKETGNDCAVSRGKFVMLNGVLKGDLKLNKTINKYLDTCLKCGKCSVFCPSNINACEIFETAKYEYAKTNFASKIWWFLESKLVFGNFLKFCKILVPRRHRLCKKAAVKLLYFKGCVNTVFPVVENAIKKILVNYDVELVEKDFECCGLPFLSSGNLERFEEVKKHNLKLFEGDYDYILTDCASCEDTIKRYGVQNVINIADFIAKYQKKFVFKKPVKITFHKPCHLSNDDFLPSVLKMCENAEYVEMSGYADCCGFAGEFVIKNSKLSRAISAKKVQNILDTETDYVLTLCPACIIGIQQGFLVQRAFRHPKVKNIVEFLALADEIV